MTNQIRPVQINNSSDICLETNFNCQSIYLSEFPTTQSKSDNSTNVAHREVRNMINYQSKLRILGMIITVPMVFLTSINPALSISLSQQLEKANSQSNLINSLFSKPIDQHQNNYFDTDHVGVANQFTTGKTAVLESANFSQESEANSLEMFLTSGYYSKDCRRRKVCDD